MRINTLVLFGSGAKYEEWDTSNAEIRKFREPGDLMVKLKVSALKGKM